MLTVSEATEITRPSQLRHVWHSLWSRTPRASFRQTPEFLQASLMTLRNGRLTSASARCDSPLSAEWQGLTDPDLDVPSMNSAAEHWRFLIVSAWQRPIGILPLRERTIRRAFGTFRTLSLPQSPWGSCPGPVGPHSATTLTAAVRHLVERDDSWDLLELPEVVANEAEPTRVPRVFDVANRTRLQGSRRELFGLELPTTFGQFWADRDAAARQRWRELEATRSLRRNEQFLRFRPRGADVGDTDRDWPLLQRLEEIVQQHDGAPHGVRSRELFERLRETHAVAVDAGSADVALLLLDARPAAFAYNFHCRSRIETAQLLADPHVPHAADRLIGWMLRDEIARGDTWHVFLPKSVLGTAVDRRLWQPIPLHETIVTHDRRTTIRSRLRRWLDGEQPLTSLRTTSVSRC